MSSANKSKLWIGLWGGFLIALSFQSGHSLYGSVGDVNFEIATMLTPLGILNILFASSDHYLRPYLHQVPQAREFLFSNGFFLAAYIGFAGVSLWLLKKLRQNG